MRPIRRILVAVKNPKARSLPAVAKAARLARAFGADLELFHAISTPVYTDTLGVAHIDLEDLKRVCRDTLIQQLEAVAETARKQDINVTTHVEWDFPVYEAIVRRATRIKADLIVAERHGGRHTAPALLQLTDWELLRLSPVPVLLVKSRRPYRNPVVLAAVDPTHAFAKTSELDDEILSAAESVKSALRGTLHAVHAYVPFPTNIPPSEYLQPNLARHLDASARADAQIGFDRVLRSVKIPPARRHLLGIHPLNAIPKVAKQTGSAIVVMGAISRSGLRRFFIGNTAEQLLDKLACDLLIVKPPLFPNKVVREKRGPRLVVAQPLSP